MRLLLPILLLATLFVASDPTPDAFQGGTPLGNGISWFKDGSGPETIHCFRIVPGQARWGFQRAGLANTAVRLSRMNAPENTVLMTNAGFFTPEYRPLGLMVEAGKLLNPLRKADWGIFWLDRQGAAHIQHRKNYKTPAEDVSFAIECGPRVLVSGRPVKVKPGKARRTLLAIRESGEILLVIIPYRIELSKAANYLKKRWSVVDALNLDGGSSTQVSIFHEDRWRHLVTGAPIPAAISLSPK